MGVWQIERYKGDIRGTWQNLSEAQVRLSKGILDKIVFGKDETVTAVVHLIVMALGVHILMGKG